MSEPVSALSSTPTPTLAPFTRTDAVAARVTAETRRSAELTIVTGDGDRVTISAAATNAVTYDAVGASVSNENGTGQAAGVSVQRSSSQSLAISVEGTLDKDELRDIQKLVKMLEKAASGRPHGHHGRHHRRSRGTDLAQQVDRANLDSLAQVTASVTVSRTVTAAAAAYQSASAPEPEPPVVDAAA